MLLNFKCLIKVRVIRFQNQPEALYRRFSSSIFCLNVSSFLVSDVYLSSISNQHYVQYKEQILPRAKGTP